HQVGAVDVEGSVDTRDTLSADVLVVLSDEVTVGIEHGHVRVELPACDGDGDAVTRAPLERVDVHVTAVLEVLTSIGRERGGDGLPGLKARNLEQVEVRSPELLGERRCGHEEGGNDEE